MYEIQRTGVNDPFYGLKVFKDGKLVGTLAIGDGQGAVDFEDQTGEFMHMSSGEKMQNVSVADVFKKYSESNKMNEDVKNLINHLANGENRKAEEVFKNVMDQKIGAAIRAKQPEVAQTMFNKKS